MFDISKTAVEETANVKLDNPEGSPLLGEDGKQLSITVYGPGSEPFAKAEAKRQNRAFQRLRRKGKAEMSPEEQRAEQADFLAAITVSFNGFTYAPAGEAIGPDLFRALYLDRKIGYIADQVQSFIADWGNFTKASATA